MDDTIDVLGDGVWGGGSTGTGSGDSPFYTWGRGVADQPGYSTDGTFNTPQAGRAVTPVDAGGGPSGLYSAQILDVFKFGVGVWNQQEQQKNMLDYKRFEATQYGAYAQGQPAVSFRANGQNLGGISGLALVAIAVFVLMKAK